MEVKRFRIACGQFIGLADVDREELEKAGTAYVPLGAPFAVGMFSARSRGGSMEPRIKNGEWCLFHPEVVGTRQDRIVSVEDHGTNGGDRYTLKKYHSEKVDRADGAWEHKQILLLPLNPGYPDIRLTSDGVYRICGWYVGSVPEIERVNRWEYPEAGN